MINDIRRDEIFEEMNSYILTLDPSATGPRYFIDKIAVCRNYLNKVSLVLSELQKDKLITSSELHKVQTIIEMESASLLSVDEHVKRLANIKDRESMVAHILRDKRKRQDQLKDQLQSIDGVMKHVALRSRELHATMDAIKNQRRFMHIEVATGAFYGDERVPTVGMGPEGTTMDPGEIAIRDLLDNDEVAEVSAALDAAMESNEAPATSAPVAPVPAAPVSGPVLIAVPPEVLEEVPEVPQATSPAPKLAATAEDDVALQEFLTTDEPSKSAAQVEIDDISSLLDDV